MAVLQQVREEVESLHEFFCGWFSGRLEKSEFDTQFTPRFAEDLVFIPPAGSSLGLEELSSSVFAGYATNPNFRIQIRNVKVHRTTDEHIVATYEEWQRNALASKPADNGRIATVLFSAGDKLKWLHIHETWLPSEIMAVGPYDF